MSEATPQAANGAHDGIFITKGMQISIPPGALQIRMGDDGAPAASLKELHVGLNMCPRWLAVAYGHLLATETASARLTEAYQARNDEGMGAALEEESTLGMQAIFSSCVAVDAYYASLKEFVEIEAETIASWRANRTARYIRIAEVMRRALHISDSGAATARAVLKQSFELRDRAVHPPAGMERPMVYDTIRRATDWRFVTFRLNNAKVVTGQVLSLVAQSLRLKPRSSSDRLPDFLKATATLIEPTLSAWEQRFGELFPRATNKGGSP